MSSIIEVTSVNDPESDGQPLGETDLHRDEMVREIELLRRFFEGQEVYVSGNLLMYYRQGNPQKCVVPDAFVVKGLQPTQRRTYRLWIERRAPDAIVEVTSRKTKKKEEGHGQQAQTLSPLGREGVLPVRSRRRLPGPGVARLSVGG